MLKYGDKDLRKRWMGTTNISTIHLGTTNIWPYITNTSVGSWVLTVTPSKTSISAAGETVTITVTGRRTTTYTWVNFVGTTTTRYTTTADETLTNYTISSSIGTVSGNNITVPYNPNTSNRNIIVTVTTNDGYSETVTIVQNKNVVTYSNWNLTFTASPTAIAAEGGTSTLNGECSRTYTNSNGQPGGTETATVTYSATLGTINGNTLTIPANTGDARNIVVTASSQGLSKSVTLTQVAQDEAVEDNWVLKTDDDSFNGQHTYLRNANIWFENEADGSKLPVDTLTASEGEIYSFEEDVINSNETKFTWHGLANVSNTPKTIIFTATNNELNITSSINIIHDVPNTSASTNWYLHCSNINGQSLTEDALVTKIVAMKSGIVPQNGQMQTQALTGGINGAVYMHDTSILFTNEGMTVNGSANSTNLVKAANGETVDFYKRNGDVVASCTYTKIGSMVVDVTKSKTLDCITGEVYPDDFV